MLLSLCSSNLLRAILEVSERIPELTFGYWDKLQLECLLVAEPLEALQAVAMRYPELRFYRILATTTLGYRLLFWRILDGLLTGEPAQSIRMGLEREDNALVTGLLEIAPAFPVCFPLLTRESPLAVLFHACNSAQFVGLVKRDPFQRPYVMNGWPVGMGHQSLEGLRPTDAPQRRLPASFSYDMLKASQSGPNALIEWLTDLAQWITAAGELAPDERWITWTSVLFGFEAMNTLAAQWGGRSAIGKPPVTRHPPRHLGRKTAGTRAFAPAA